MNLTFSVNVLNYPVELKFKYLRSIKNTAIPPPSFAIPFCFVRLGQRITFSARACFANIKYIKYIITYFIRIHRYPLRSSKIEKLGNRTTPLRRMRIVMPRQHIATWPPTKISEIVSKYPDMYAHISISQLVT